MLIITILFSFLSDSTTEWQLIRKVNIPEVVTLSTDLQQNLYLLTTEGELLRHDSTCRQSALYSPQKFTLPSHIEAWNRLNTMLFYRESQELWLVDRFLQNTHEVPLPCLTDCFFTAATPSASGGVWLFDTTNFRLVNVSNQNQVVFEWRLEAIPQLSSEFEVAFLREYQNLLFIADRKQGVLIFDLLGNLRKQLPTTVTEWLGFTGETCYWLSETQDTLIVFHIFEGTTSQISLPQKATHVLYFGDTLYLFSPNRELMKFVHP